MLLEDATALLKAAASALLIAYVVLVAVERATASLLESALRLEASPVLNDLRLEASALERALVLLVAMASAVELLLESAATEEADTLLSAASELFEATIALESAPASPPLSAARALLEAAVAVLRARIPAALKASRLEASAILRTVVALRAI